jgi:hypothetical protein
MLKNNNSQDLELKVKEIAKLYLNKVEQIDDIAKLSEPTRFIDNSNTYEEIQKILLDECREANSSWKYLFNKNMTDSIR